jgi:hypothetical protein
MDFIDEIKQIHCCDLKDKIREAAKIGKTQLDYVTEHMDCSDAKKILGRGFYVERMTYDTLIITWSF